MKKYSFKTMIKMYALLTQGTIAIAFGLMAPMLVGAIGLSVDISQSYLARQRLHGAIDSAALAAAATSQDSDEIAARVVDFITENYPTSKIGILNEEDIEVDVTESEVTVTASVIYPTTFMSIFGFKTITVSSGVVVAREIKGLEVVLVLDNTGSLGAANMSSVRTAAKNFVQILFDRVAEPEDIKIGVVPYAASVRVGRYGLGQFPDGTAGYGVPFVTLPSGVNSAVLPDDSPSDGVDDLADAHQSTNWYGCIVEHKNTASHPYSAAATHVANTRGQLWTTSGTGLCTSTSSAANCRGHGWAPSSSSNDPYPYDTQDIYTGPWDIYVYGRIIPSGDECDDYSNYSNSRCSSCTGSGGNCNKTYCYCWRSQPNESCPYANVLPLSSDEAAINATLDSMDYHGSTYSNIGMAWGMRMLSPEEPFIEGAEWEDEEWNKAIVLMTDGEMSPSSVYSAYWPAGNESISINTMNTRLQEVCTWLKAEPRNVIIYTVTFDHATSDITAATKAIYRNCATDADHYFDAPTQANLVTAFERISGALANLHLKR